MHISFGMPKRITIGRTRASLSVSSSNPLNKHLNVERVDCITFFCPFLIKDCSQLPSAQSRAKNLELLLIFYRRHLSRALHRRRQKGKQILVMGRWYVDGSPSDECIVYIVLI